LGKMGYKLELHVRKTDLSQKSARSPAFFQKHSTAQKQRQRKPVQRLNHGRVLVVRENKGSRAKKKKAQRVSAIRGHDRKKRESREGRPKANSKAWCRVLWEG